MSKISQKNAVIREVTKTLGSSFDNSVPAYDLLSDEQISKVRKSITDGIINGDIEFSLPVKTERDVYLYVCGLVSNHLRKATQLNGNVVYKPKAKSNDADPVIFELKKLLATFPENSEKFINTQQAIEQRLKELNDLKPVKIKTKSSGVNWDITPRSLNHLASDNWY